MTGVLHNQHDAAAYRLPSELLIQVAENFSISDLVAATHVSRLWRGTLLPCPTLWARLDMVCFEEKALTFIPYLLPRSKARPLELSMHVFIIFDPSFAVIVQDFYRALAPHSHRLWRISLHCSSYMIIRPLFSLLRSGAPILESLDLVRCQHDGDTCPLDLFFTSTPQFSFWNFTRTPQLSCIRWDGFPMPAALDGLSNVTSIRICQHSIPARSAVFDLFPRARSVRVDQCTRLDVLGTIPSAHPVEQLELAVDGGSLVAYPPQISWSELHERRCMEVPILVLRNYRLSMLFEACRDRVWHAQSLTIKYKDEVDAVLRHGARECRMIGLRQAMHVDWRGAEQLMHEFACLRTVEHLEITLPLARRVPLVPQLRMHQLTTLVILCARSMKGEGEFSETRLPESLLDPEPLAHCGTLRAMKLKMLVLKYYPCIADWQDPAYDGIIDTAALANFINGHIKIDGGGGLLPELRIDSPRLRLADDVEGMAALTAAVGAIVLGL